MTSFGFNFDNSYLSLPDALYSRLDPAPVPDPRLIILNDDLAEELGLDFSHSTEMEKSALFSGKSLPKGAQPLAQAYAGHQFGHFTILGDGRAHLWGEHMTPHGTRCDIQFKGSGRTPYSRGGDGRAALGPMLREYLMAEAMHALGIPTTRSLAVATTGDTVMRDKPLPGAVLTRIAASHIRVGTFEFATLEGRDAMTRVLMNYTITRHDPDITDADNLAIAFLKRVMGRQADLITHWMRVGFIHGVMNTDNMTISGETIDYGPCAFMDVYNPGTVFSSIDHAGRYAYANQPVIAGWNIARLAETLIPLIDDDVQVAVQKAEGTVNDFPELYQKKWLSMMGRKLGFKKLHKGDDQLISSLLDWMQKTHADYTNTFRDLTMGVMPSQDSEFRVWYEQWQDRLKLHGQTIDHARAIMQQNNPAVIPRNHNVEMALAAANAGDMQPFHNLMNALKTPYAYGDESLATYQSPPQSGERVYQTFCGT